MEIRENNKKPMSFGRFFSVCLMVACLTLLTSMNFFIYSSPDRVVSAIIDIDYEDSSNNFPPTGPTEEKCSNSGFSFSEEILHEAYPEFNFSSVNHLYLHHIEEADNIEVFHPERILPPPKI